MIQPGPSVIANFMPLLSVFIAEESLCKKKKKKEKKKTKDGGGIPETPERRDMNLNDFVVLPNNKAKSVKLNAR